MNNSRNFPAVLFVYCYFISSRACEIAASVICAPESSCAISCSFSSAFSGIMVDWVLPETSRLMTL